MMIFRSEAISSSLCALTVLLLFMFTPIFGLYSIWPFTSALTSGLTLSFIGFFFGIMLLSRRECGFHFNTPVFYFLGLITVLSCSVALNSYVHESTWRWYLITFIACVMALVAASELKANDSQKYNEKLSYFLWVGCLIYSVFSLLKYYGLLTLILPLADPPSGRLVGIWGQPNLTTTTCWLGLLAGSAAFSTKKEKGLWHASILVFGWTLACAASRMSWLMVAGLLALIFVSQLSRFRMEETRVASRSLGRAVVLVAMLLILVPLINQPLRGALISSGLLAAQDPVVSLADRNVFHNSARLTEFSKVFSEADTLSWSQWLFGVGPGNYPVFSYQADMALPPEGLEQGTWMHSHNLFSMVFIEFGLVGLAVVLAFVVSIGKAALKQPMNLPRFFSIGAIGLLFIHSNLEFPLWYLWFLVLLCLLLTNLFPVREVKGESSWLKPVVGISGFVMVTLLLFNTGYQYVRISQVAMNPNRDAQDLRALALLANDSLMGPYAVLRKYRDFAPESSNIDWQLREVRRMKAWQPKDLVVLREFSLLVLNQDMPAACKVAQQAAYRYPHSGPIMLDHSLLAGNLSRLQITEIANCIETGLAGRGETIESVHRSNQAKMFQ